MTSISSVESAHSLSMYKPSILRRTGDFVVNQQAWFLSSRGSWSSVKTDVNDFNRII